MPFNSLYKNIFDKNDEEDNSNVMLQQTVKDYPYFTLAHFFLFKQTDLLNEQYNSIAAKTALHFNNPFLLQEHLLKEPEPVYQEIINEFELPEAYAAEIIIVPEIEQVEIIQEIEMPAIMDEETAAYTTEKMEEPVYNEEIHEIEPPETYEEEIIITPENEPVEIIREVEIPVIIAEATTSYTTEENKETVEEEEPMIFEPLFATDYFASQGIKLRDEIQPADKLGKQLKSFTDWLKTMKKVHESKLPPGNDALDISVQTLAEKSNQEEDVLTETMAEVFLQQGKLNKAKEIYEKLSLLNPSKIAYFAAKIEQIQ